MKNTNKQLLHLSYKVWTERGNAMPQEQKQKTTNRQVLMDKLMWMHERAHSKDTPQRHRAATKWEHEPAI